jgi:hypothetical protein
MAFKLLEDVGKARADRMTDGRLKNGLHHGPKTLELKRLPQEEKRRTKELFCLAERKQTAAHRGKRAPQRIPQRNGGDGVDRKP